MSKRVVMRVVGMTFLLAWAVTPTLADSGAVQGTG